ncbi:hypothetical protein CkaCkLH20_11418 [Colletotrichum karsti]|uniref:Uncharacterized protein n=1 Tax=Colletotrichum karsti TaxID=1095194 RepID=A0A9P6HXS6_9PEZI|nr:uncharacterized protein CkaCkLH20_11418 [Colletotrichum karsti]KAF9871001.1 hypothetical protein CkaCkLH20_11418 [Colletotrichum karsti]
MPETTRKTNATKAVLDTPRNSQKKAALPFEIFLDIAELAVAEIADKTDTEYWDLEWDDDTASNVLLCYGFNGPEPDQHDFHQRWRYRKISTFMQINHMTRSTVTKAALVIFPLQKRRKKDIGKAFIFPKRDKFNLIAYHWSIFGSSPRPTIWNAMECPNNAFKPLWNRLSCVVVDSPYFFQQTNGKKANILLALPGLAAKMKTIFSSFFK